MSKKNQKQSHVKNNYKNYFIQREKKSWLMIMVKNWLRNLIIVEIFMKTTCKTYFVAYFFFFFGHVATVFIGFGINKSVHEIFTFLVCTRLVFPHQNILHVCKLRKYK